MNMINKIAKIKEYLRKFKKFSLFSFLIFSFILISNAHAWSSQMVIRTRANNHRDFYNLGQSGPFVAGQDPYFYINEVSLTYEHLYRLTVRVSYYNDALDNCFASFPFSAGDYLLEMSNANSFSNYKYIKNLSKDFNTSEVIGETTATLYIVPDQDLNNKRLYFAFSPSEEELISYEETFNDSYCDVDLILKFNSIELEDLGHKDSTSAVKALVNQKNEELKNEIKAQKEEIKKTNKELGNLNNFLNEPLKKDTEPSKSLKAPTGSIFGGTIKGTTSKMILLIPSFLVRLGESANRCTPLNVGTLMGHAIVFPCISMSKYIGTTAWSVIDKIATTSLLFVFVRKLIQIVTNMKGMKEGNPID